MSYLGSKLKHKPPVSAAFSAISSLIRTSTGGRLFTSSGIDLIGDVPWGAHFCQFYQTKQDLIDILVPYFREGLLRNEFCMWITSEPLQVAEAKQALQEAVPDLDDYLDRGQIEILDYSQWYTVTGKFEADRVLQGWLDKETHALQSGFNGLRLTGNTFWLEKKDWQDFSDYEAKINEVIGNHRMIAVCTYSIEKCGSYELIDVVSNHQFALIKQTGHWKIIESRQQLKTKTALQDSEHRYKSLVELSPLAIGVHRKGRYIYVNPACAQLFGAARSDEMIGRKVLDFVHPDDRRAVAKRISQLQKTGYIPPVNESKLIRLDGQAIHISGSATEINYDGAPAIQVVMQDNTERKRAEEALRRAHDALGMQVQEKSADLAKAVETLEKEARRRSAVQELVLEQSRILEAFVKHSITPLVFLDKNFNFIRVNEAYAKSCQRNVEDFTGHNHFEFYPFAENEAIFGNVVQSKKPYQAVAKPFTFPDHPEWGVTYWDWTLTPILDQNEDIDFLVFSLEDVTKRVKTEKALAQSEIRYRSLTLATTEIVWTTNAAGEVVDDMPYWREFTGQTELEIKSWGWSDAVHPDDRDRTKAVWSEAVREGKFYEVEYRLRRRDGQYRHLSVRGVPVMEDGNISEWVGTCVDITEQKRMQEALRKASLYARSLIEAGLDPLVTISHDGRITDVNNATELVTGVNRERLIGSDFSSYFTDPAKAKKGYQKVLVHGFVKDYPLTIRHTSGHKTDVLYNATVYKNEAGEVQGVFAAARDITEHKKMDEQLQVLHEALARRATQLQTLASELTLTEHRERRRLAQLLHDQLQQILYAARLGVSSLKRRISDKDQLQMIQELDALLSQCIDESRLLTIELSPPVLYDAGLAPALDWLARQMQSHYGLSVEVEADADAEPETEDIKVLLFQSVRELLFNVVKHAGAKDASVKMSFALGGQIRIDVVDQGAGFNPDRLGTDDRKQQGFGLFSIRERLEQMGGRMELTAAAGKGTSVSIYAPSSCRQLSNQAEALIEPPLDATPAISTDEQLQESPRRIIRVLLADDHTILRKGLVGVLSQEPDIDVVAEAVDGEMAVELVKQHKPDVVLMDVTMPKVDGIEATRRITAMQLGVSIIGYSAHKEEDLAQALYKAGAVAYLSKDEPAELLIAAIRNIQSFPPPS
jgi:PAS domain S-box-containing protein